MLYTLLLLCCASFNEECLQHHRHTGDPGVTLEICNTIGKKAQLIVHWREPWALRTPPTHEN
jgi:hypothetical protein